MACKNENKKRIHKHTGGKYDDNICRRNCKKRYYPKYGQYVWIELTYNNTYDVVANDTVLKNCKSLTSAKRWVSTNL